MLIHVGKRDPRPSALVIVRQIKRDYLDPITVSEESADFGDEENANHIMNAQICSFCVPLLAFLCNIIRYLFLSYLHYYYYHFSNTCLIT